MTMLSLIPRERMFEMLKECREQFAFYGTNHRAKVDKLADAHGPNSPQVNDTLAKAQVNEEFVRRIDRLIGEPGPAKLPDDLAETSAAKPS